MLISLLILVFCTNALQITSERQIEAVQGLISRVLGKVFFLSISYLQKYIELIELRIVHQEKENYDHFSLLQTEEENHLVIEGTSGVALSYGLHMFLFLLY